MNLKKSVSFFFFLASLCQFSHGDLIADVCSKSKDASFCQKTLRADPRAPKADLKGLAQITIDISKTSAQSGFALTTKHLNAANDIYSKVIYRACMDNYKDAVDDATQLTGLLNKGDYANLIGYAETASTGLYLSDCEDAFKDASKFVNEPPQIVALNNNLKGLSDILKTISVLSKGSK